MSPLGITIVFAAILAAGFFLLVTIIKNTYVCPPSEVLIFSGRRRRLPATAGPHDRSEVGFRVVRGGRAMRIPLIEQVDRMTLTNLAIELSVTNAYSRGGIPLKVHAVANVKIPSEEPLLHNAIERFLGYPREGIIRVAKDTLEGNLRGVIAELTPEEINQQKVIFQQKLIEEADKDLQRLGLVLDNLQIQNIADEVGYLASVGRVRTANVTKEARIGEVKARASAHVQKARNQMEAGIYGGILLPAADHDAQSPFQHRIYVRQYSGSGQQGARNHRGRCRDGIEHIIDKGNIISADFEEGSRSECDDGGGGTHPLESITQLQDAHLRGDTGYQQRHEHAKAGRGTQAESHEQTD